MIRKRPMSKDERYEAEKKRLQGINLTYDEYDKAIKKWLAKNKY